MNGSKFICGAALCAAAGLLIGGAFAATGGTTPADTEPIRRIASAERYEITKLKAEPDHVFVEYVLRPTTSSYIRCQLAMPVCAAKWDGRLWGFGNGGPAGHVAVDVGIAKRGSAAVHTDMGTSKGVCGNHEALIDFGWRATHLMTVSAKKFVTAYFGKAPTRCYFHGVSTGGGQGFHEALRFPEDYDGILSYVPANTRLPLHIYFAWNLRLQCDRNGRRLFTDAEFAAVENAAIDYFADKDKPFARGRFLSDSRYAPEAERGILELAKKKCPSLAEGDKLERLHKMFTGPVLDGKRIHAGIPFSARLKSGAGNQWMLNWYFGPSRAPHTVTDAELAAWLREWSPICDACGEGFAAFAKRGGKMIVVGGLEDSVVPYPSMIDWYERATAELGGRKNLEEACHLYLLPGRAHGRGRGCGNVLDDHRLIVDWVEKGVRPDDVTCDLTSGEKLTVRPYPACFERPVNIWPQPAEMARSTDYAVSVDGSPVDVLQTKVAQMYLPPGTAHPYSFATFEAEGEVTVEVSLLSTNVVWGEAKVLPSKLGARVERIADGKARITLKAPCTAQFEPNGRHRALVLAIQPRERNAPKPGDKGVVYVGPGIHRRAITEIGSGETLYLAPGAVLEGGVRVKGDNATVCGRGILSGEPWAWQKGPEWTSGKRVGHLLDGAGRNLSIRDVILTSSWGWTLVLNSVTNALVDNVKVLCGRVLNDDGIDICRAKDVTVRNSFVRAQDDCLAVKWWCDNLLVTNCTFMVDFANAMRVGYECESASFSMRNIRVCDVDILHLASKKSDPASYWGQSAFCIQASHGQTFENLLFENIRIAATEKGDNFLVTRTMPINPGFRYHKGFSFDEPGYITNLVFRNVAVAGTARLAVYLESHDARHTITDFRFENVTGCAAPRRKVCKVGPAVNLAAPSADAPLTLEAILDEMTDRDSVARFTSRRTTTRLWSSRDPASVKPGTDAWFANGDAGQFIRDEMRGGHVEKVMVDAEGPGVMTSAFFAGPAENTNHIVRLYIDGGTEPVVEAPAYAFADGGVFCGAPLSVALSPLTPDYWRRGHNLFLPIPFSRRLKLTCEIRPAAKWAPFYYNVQTIRYPVGTVVESYSREVADRAASAIAAANARLGADRPVPEGQSVSLDGCLAPGASVKRRFDGAGAIRYLSLRPRRTPTGCARGRDNPEMYFIHGSHVDFDEVEVAISFDGVETVRCPVGLLFGAGTFRAAEFRTWFSACSSDGRLESFWVMPFAESCEITLVNRSDAPVRIEDSKVVRGTFDFSKGEALRFGLAAVRRRDIPTRKRGGHYDLRLAELTGAGKIVGVGVSVVNRAQCWWGEGDPKIFIDGEKTPSYFGTGTEDLFCYAYGGSSKGSLFSHPFAAQPIGEGNWSGGATVNVRYWTYDAIAFTRSLVFDMEMWSWAATRMDYDSVVFFYSERR